MEQPCHKCGQSVEEGTAFCPHCGAPQIRVAIAEMIPAAAGESILTAARAESSSRAPDVSLPLRWSHVLSACGAAALLGAVAMMLGLTFPAGVLGAGFIAVTLYSRRTLEPVRAARGAQLGAISGIFCFAITGIFVALASTAQDFRTKIHSQILDSAQKWAASHPADPQVQAALDQLKSPEGLIAMLIIGGVIFSLLFVALGSLGGVLGGAILRRRDRS